MRFNSFPFSVPCISITGIVVATSMLAAGSPVWQGRPFVRVVKQGDPIPGTQGGVFNTLTSLTLKDGVVHFVGGQSATQKGLFRWEKGVLTTLVYTNTPTPGGGRFDTVHFGTAETGGALNFVGEVFFGRPGFVYGLFQLSGGKITPVLDTAHTYEGKNFMGFGYPVRAGASVVWSSSTIAGGVQQSGIYRWDGTKLLTVIDGSTDLPGSLGKYTGTGAYQLAFDGVNVGFVGTDGTRANAVTGVYRVGADGVVSKLVDGNDAFPGGGSYFAEGFKFANVDVDGTNTFYGAGSLVAAAGGNRFYTSDGVRYNGGTFNPATATFGTDGEMELVLNPTDADGVTPLTLDGQSWRAAEALDGDGDDVAFLLRLADNKLSIYAAIGSGSAPVVVAAPALAGAGVANGVFQFQFAGAAGVNYRVEFKSALGSPAWVPRGQFTGKGAAISFGEAIEGAGGFYRVVTVP